MKKNKAKKRTAEDIQKLVDRYERGETLREIGESEDLSRERIRQLFEQVGYKRRKTTFSKVLLESIARRQTRLPRAELERLYLVENMTAREISEILKCKRESVYPNLRRYNIPVRRYTRRKASYPPTFPLLTKENLHRWYIEERKHVRQIAETVDCSITTVYLRLKAFGIKKPPTPPRRRKSRAAKKPPAASE